MVCFRYIIVNTLHKVDDDDDDDDDNNNNNNNNNNSPHIFSFTIFAVNYYEKSSGLSSSYPPFF
jgi:hypothetical protein